MALRVRLCARTVAQRTARRVVLGGVRQLLFRNRRVVTTFPSRAGETISLMPNRCNYEKLKDVTASRKSGELTPRNPKTSGRVSHEIGVSDQRTPPQRSRSESRRSFTNVTSPQKRRSKIKIMVQQVRHSMQHFSETARATNLKICDLFPSSRMLAHVTATPVSRSTKGNVKHVYPSPGLGRHPIPVPNASTSFQER